MKLRRARSAVIARRWIVAVVATISVLVPISAASQPSAMAAASTHTASGRSQGSVNALTCGSFFWYLQNAGHYLVGFDTTDNTHVAVSEGLLAAQVRWNFCRVGTNPVGYPVFIIQVHAAYQNHDLGECAVSTGSYFTFGSCSSAGVDFTELPVAGGGGFLLASDYILNHFDRTEVIAVHAAADNYRLFLTSPGTGWQVWNAVPCGSVISC